GKEFGLRLFALLEDGEDGEFLEEVARHLVQLGLAGRGDDHAEVQGVALELRLHREALDLLDGVPGDKDFLRRLQDVLVLRRKVTPARRGAARTPKPTRRRQHWPPPPPAGSAHRGLLSPLDQAHRCSNRSPRRRRSCPARLAPPGKPRPPRDATRPKCASLPR